MAARDILAAWFARNSGRWADQVLNTLKTNGYSVVRLPNPDTSSGQPIWKTPAAAVTVQDGRVHIEVDDPMGATDAQGFAAALLAAAYALGGKQ
ncbi:hypothetical protein [Rhodococcus opacus]|uniref:hypothetical protein n=1 Tax=Rhodococcus opacus TaxID=37919 RepID=UPI0024B9AB6E|nr:hypothetical protein [Rhodococcus opacus]MDJ0413825.1 hypothetical protein [Rhodococcus opacus]